MTREISAPITEATSFVQSQTLVRPKVGVVLGSGLGALGEMLEEAIPYTQIPSMPSSTVPGHAGRLRIGTLQGVEIACLQGRVHLYEGLAPSTVVFGVRLLAQLGCKVVLLTNAAGGIARRLRPGDRMLITDHLNLTGQNPLVGLQGGNLGPQFVDMGGAIQDRSGAVCGPYDNTLGELAHAAAESLGQQIQTGVYAGVLGPSYETPAEVRMLRTLGADAVGMSTVHEVIALRQLGVRVAAISCITNLAAGIAAEPLDHRDVQRIALETSGPFVQLMSKWIALIGKDVGS